MRITDSCMIAVSLIANEGQLGVQFSDGGKIRQPSFHPWMQL